jgi:hypothetical protein
MLNYSLRVDLEQFGFMHSSNYLNFSIRLYPFGHVLQADMVLFYKCVPCQAGAFVNISNSDPAFCAKCPSGRCSKALSTMCSECSKGKVSQEGQADSCMECQLGTFAISGGLSTCTICEEGIYADELGSLSCKKCPNNSITLQLAFAERVSLEVFQANWDAECVQFCEE